jgi:hypothetical protein
MFMFTPTITLLKGSPLYRSGVFMCRLALPLEMIRPVKLVDDNQNWIESGMEVDIVLV